MIGQQAYCLR